MERKRGKFQTIAKDIILKISMSFIFVILVAGLALGHGVAGSILWSWSRLKESLSH